ncbi:hypothetical protein ACH4LT_20660 [Streptomyces clavifer]|uniref:hypothetical protein n=1 Tax=Streptomyces clavifer TaxID=68188 RepID=UPI00379837EF
MCTLYLPDGHIVLKRIDERAIRTPAMAALAAATALTTGTYDPQTLSAANATIRTRNLVRTLAARHRANNADRATRWGERLADRAVGVLHRTGRLAVLGEAGRRRARPPCRHAGLGGRPPDPQTFPLPDGGTSPIYRADTAETYYPEGNDWGTHLPFHFGNFDLLVSLTAQDTGINPAAAKWERLHNEAQLDLMSRFTDGRTYGAGSENTYYGREPRIGAMAAQAYLTLFLARNSTGDRLRWK